MPEDNTRPYPAEWLPELDNPEEEAVDGYTWAEIRNMVFDSLVEAICDQCGAVYTVEPDARGYDCFDGCRATGTVTSPLVKLDLI
jgi:hypothetical protein